MSSLPTAAECSTQTAEYSIRFPDIALEDVPPNVTDWEETDCTFDADDNYAWTVVLRDKLGHTLTCICTAYYGVDGDDAFLKSVFIREYTLRDINGEVLVEAERPHEHPSQFTLKLDGHLEYIIDERVVEQFTHADHVAIRQRIEDAKGGK